MRRVKVNERVVYDKETNKYIVRSKGEGIFHQFGFDYEEFEAGPGNYSTAIIEFPDGKVEGVPLHLFEFCDPQTPEQ